MPFRILLERVHIPFDFKTNFFYILVSFLPFSLPEMPISQFGTQQYAYNMAATSSGGVKSTSPKSTGVQVVVALKILITTGVEVTL